MSRFSGPMVSRGAKLVPHFPQLFREKKYTEVFPFSAGDISLKFLSSVRQGRNFGSPVKGVANCQNKNLCVAKNTFAKTTKNLFDAFIAI